MFEQFPYTNFHDLNLDWILKIAKDFLDQYTHIQDLIQNGITSIDNETLAKLQELNDLADQLEAALNEWYNTHQSDIANQLSTAIYQFNQSADTKAEEARASIPSDYTTLSDNVRELQELAHSTTDLKPYMHIVANMKWNGAVGELPYDLPATNGRFMAQAPLKLPAGTYELLIHPGYAFSWRTLDNNFRILADSGYLSGTQTITADGNTWYVFGGVSSDAHTMTDEEAENAIDFYSVDNEVNLETDIETEQYKITNIANLLVTGVTQSGNPGVQVADYPSNSRATSVYPVKLEKGNYIVKIGAPYRASYRVVTDSGLIVYSSDWFNDNMAIVSSGQFRYHFTLSRQDNTDITNVTEMKAAFDVIFIKPGVVNSATCMNHYEAVGHRGENTIAPENTIPAIKLAKIGNYDIVEVDVRFTSNNIPVLLHDETINRTARNADGTTISDTIPIASITKGQADTYDFGIWKAPIYAGTKIPTLHQFLKVCKEINLKPRIELLVYDKTHLSIMMDAIDAYGLLHDVQYNINDLTLISSVLNIVPDAEIVYGISEYNESILASLGAMKTEHNRIIINANQTLLNDTLYTACRLHKLELEIYTIDNPTTAANLPALVTGMTSNRINNNLLLYYNQNMV